MKEDPVTFLPRLASMPFKIRVHFLTLIVHATIIFPRIARMVRRMEGEGFSTTFLLLYTARPESNKMDREFLVSKPLANH